MKFPFNIISLIFCLYIFSQVSGVRFEDKTNNSTSMNRKGLGLNEVST